jgi:hypothetical protein
MELLAALAEHAAASDRRMGSHTIWRHRRAGGAAACRPGEHSHAAQARLKRECPDTCPTARYSAATGTVVGFRTRGIAPPTTDGAHELGNRKRQGPAGRVGARRHSLGRPDHTRSLPRHCRTRCAGAPVRPDHCSPGVSATLGHSLAPLHDFAGAPRSAAGARYGFGISGSDSAQLATWRRLEP